MLSCSNFSPSLCCHQNSGWKIPADRFLSDSSRLPKLLQSDIWFFLHLPDPDILSRFFSVPASVSARNETFRQSVLCMRFLILSAPGAGVAVSSFQESCQDAGKPRPHFLKHSIQQFHSVDAAQIHFLFIHDFVDFKQNFFQLPSHIFISRKQKSGSGNCCPLILCIF